MAMSRAPRVHPAWIVLGALTVCMLAGSGLRSVFGVYIKPMEAEFGWTRGALSGAAAVSLLLLGAVGLALGAIGSSFIQKLWHVYVMTGVFMALGAGGVALTTGSTVVARWFEARRGLAIGIAAGGMSAGQLIVIPLATALTVWFGWRTSFLWLGIGLLVLVLPVCLALIRNNPEDRGARPYGATGPAPTRAEAEATRVAGRVGVSEAAQTLPFWLLMGTFFVCGYTSNGMVLTHFMPHALEHNFTAFQASSALGVMGAMNIMGTLASGWICDRFGRRGPLATYYFVRGVSLLFLLYVWNVPSLHLWAALFGLNYISTVPPTTTLTANIYGPYSVGELSGWIFFAHQVGSALGAALAGWVFELTGTYSSAFLSAAVLAFVAAGLAMMIREEPLVSRPTAAPVPATS